MYVCICIYIYICIHSKAGRIITIIIIHIIRPCRWRTAAPRAPQELSLLLLVLLLLLLLLVRSSSSSSK